MTIYIDLKDESLESYNINKDSCNVHFSIYIEKYESKKERDKAIQKYKKEELKIQQQYEIEKQRQNNEFKKQNYFCNHTICFSF